MFLNKNVDICLRSFSSNHIDVSVNWESLHWRFTGCYAPARPQERGAFWELLFKLWMVRQSENEPWIIGGDFNEVLYDSEKIGGRRRCGGRFNNFPECCQSVGIQSVKYTGPAWTWTNGRKGTANIKQRLDRFLANAHWKNLFPNAVSHNCGFFGSDHRVVKLNLNLKKWIVKTPQNKPFIFENKWTAEEDYRDQIQKAWENSVNTHSLPEKLMKCGQLVKQWADLKVGNTQEKIEKLRRETDSLHNSDASNEETKYLEKEL